MSFLTGFLGIVGIVSFVAFFLIRFKASSKQTDRSNRIKWSSYIPYRQSTESKGQEKTLTKTRTKLNTMNSENKVGVNN